MENKSKWHLFIISIGLIIIAMSPVVGKPLYNLIMGGVIVGFGFYLLRKK